MINLVLSNNDALIIQKNPIIGHLNENSLRKKLKDFKELILNERDVFLIFEWKLDIVFQMFSVTVKDTDYFVRTEPNSGVKIILSVKENIPRKIINSQRFKSSICNKK